MVNDCEHTLTGSDDALGQCDSLMASDAPTCAESPVDREQAPSQKRFRRSLGGCVCPDASSLDLDPSPVRALGNSDKLPVVAAMPVQGEESDEDLMMVDSQPCLFKIDWFR